MQKTYAKRSVNVPLTADRKKARRYRALKINGGSYETSLEPFSFSKVRPRSSLKISNSLLPRSRHNNRLRLVSFAYLPLRSRSGGPSLRPVMPDQRVFVRAGDGCFRKSFSKSYPTPAKRPARISGRRSERGDFHASRSPVSRRLQTLSSP